ncbi:MAG: NADH-quinone oxidoreductase subunit [Actinomycetota bacterium]|jgi:NADH:ubiquinone oxidoreductase subunit F (NADH-binding)|nr:NADH-quinone oxidoreductase subunit [Actinomycetota bacterium]
MPPHSRVLDAAPVRTLDDYLRGGGGQALALARKAEPEGVIGALEASGLRGRGGAGFPTGTKWRTVYDSRSDVLSSTVVVNAAEGEPGTFKDRAILRANPYRVLEGALVAAATIGADTVIVGLKASFSTELARVRAAIEEIRAAAWSEGVELVVVEGPSHYLYGEETALLEVIAGRNPFPRIAPPFRHGVDELGPDTKSPADEAMASPTDDTVAAPTLVNNAETMANVPGIVVEGPDWFRSVGTAKSPGTIVCTVTGRTRRHGVGEFAMGTPLREVIETLGGGLRPGEQVTAVLSGVANALLPGHLLDTPLTYEDMAEAGAGLGSAGFIVFDGTSDLVAVAAGASRFLAVESCGQCTPCKQDGLTIAGLLERLAGEEAADAVDLDALRSRLGTVTNSARCYLATQHQVVVESLLRLFPEAVQAHADGQAPAVEPELIVPIVDIDGDVAQLDEDHVSKQPDWTHDLGEFSGQSPADRSDASTPNL